MNCWTYSTDHKKLAPINRICLIRDLLALLALFGIFFGLVSQRFEVVFPNLTIFVNTFGINTIDPALVKENKEYHIVSEAGQSMKNRHLHLDTKGEKVIDDGSECFVYHGLQLEKINRTRWIRTRKSVADLRGHMRHALQLVVDDQLRDKLCKSEHVDEPTAQLDNTYVKHSRDRHTNIPSKKRNSHIGDISEGESIVSRGYCM
ncbi:hypothetical protein AG1IA_04362 [Rhizoctonia solani AG-1 IA]|uniref:Uncharacterized protein n=1 Tax=Thanatephorus cucumeris (strain AG1-IA) TaxID=983506 RepID=L8WUD5_THACA|nr:hypothetical protein AG1IA_04362 [Rhizoctonia solani AG-1 IA]